MRYIIKELKICIFLPLLTHSILFFFFSLSLSPVYLYIQLYHSGEGVYIPLSLKTPY